MKPFLLVAVLTGCVLTMPARAGGDDRYGASCAKCHAAGALGAPKTGDRAAWAPRLSQGLPVLVGHVKNGFRNMPAKGLCNDCDDADYEALIKYMSQ